MYDHYFVLKVIGSFSRAYPRAWGAVLTILKKTIKDVYNLFQIDQNGWEILKYIIKSKQIEWTLFNSIPGDENQIFKTTIQMYSSSERIGKNIQEARKNDLTKFFFELYS